MFTQNELDLLYVLVEEELMRIEDIIADMPETLKSTDDINFLNALLDKLKVGNNVDNSL